MVHKLGLGKNKKGHDGLDLVGAKIIRTTPSALLGVFLHQEGCRLQYPFHLQEACIAHLKLWGCHQCAARADQRQRSVLC